ncbi:LPXTG cell wall anchor domain-containing protein [Brevibacterium sp. p3-SID960]|uniref:LPXTG cell wall anchor domain-containing protein n=1 Tax=Brevibacterium sp. p3-SID960 TaxID=2916063 RepID=UPI0021A83417|nr:LPXTG cell wall anchor domain-containing protein [Brevibacterium sp. p3-SID960]MCT1691362.1 LPXTG cell wall anchor domain-containing protein [Brevibacterium sp. p3-SID960]
MHKIPALPAAGALAAAPFVGSAAAHAADPADTSGPEQEQKRELTFALTSQTIKDDSTYGLVEEYRFDVTNSGDVPTDGTLRAFNDKDENYIDDEGQEMWLACDWIFPGLEPGRTITCTMQVRIVDSELTAGKTDPQQVHFRGFKGQEKAFAGFTTASLPIPAEFLPEDDADDDSGTEEQPGDDRDDEATAPEDTPAPEDEATDDDSAGDENTGEEPDGAADEDEKSDDAQAGSEDSKKSGDAKRASGTLPRTGSETAALAAGGAALLVVGGAAVAVTMRRRTARS